jgi:hypothetical protein
VAAEIIRPCVLTMIAPHVVFVDGIITAVCTDSVTAHRLAELVERHGLVDVPDTAEGAHQ